MFVGQKVHDEMVAKKDGEIDNLKKQVALYKKKYQALFNISNLDEKQKIELDPSYIELQSNIHTPEEDKANAEEYNRKVVEVIHEPKIQVGTAMSKAMKDRKIANGCLRAQIPVFVSHDNTILSLYHSDNTPSGSHSSHPTESACSESYMPHIEELQGEYDTDCGEWHILDVEFPKFTPNIVEIK